MSRIDEAIAPQPDHGKQEQKKREEHEKEVSSTCVDEVVVSRNKAETTTTAAEQGKQQKENSIAPLNEVVNCKDKVETMDAGTKKLYLSSRCGVQEFCELLDSLCDDKKKVIGEMGFGGLLHLKKHKLKLQLLEKLMMRFNVGTSQLNVHGNRLTISVDDVVSILGLHAEGMNVKTQLGDHDDGVRVKFNVGTGQIKCSILRADLVNDLTVGEEFRGKFLLYLMSRLLNPSTSVYVPNDYFKILTNIDVVGNLNWAKFVYDGLLEGIKDYQSKPTGSSSKKQSVTGCTLLLEIFYLDHVQLHDFTRNLELFPRIRVWDEDSISNIVKKVSSLGGVDSIKVGFGRDVANGSTIEDVRAELIQLRSDFKEEIHFTRSRLDSFKEEFSSSMSQVMTILSSLQNQLQREASSKIRNHDENAHSNSREQVNVPSLDAHEDTLKCPTGDKVINEKTNEEGRTPVKGTSSAGKDSEDDFGTNENSTNLYDNLNNVKKKEDTVELSDDASSPIKLSEVKKRKKGKEGFVGSKNEIPSENVKKRKPIELVGDESDSFEALLNADPKGQPRVNRKMELRNPDTLKSGPQLLSPYLPAEPSRRGRGGHKGPKKGGGGRKRKITEDDPVSILPDYTENLWTFVFTMKSLFNTPSTTLVEFDNYHVTREELASINDGKHLQSGVINLVAAGLTQAYRGCNRSDYWFMPWAFTNHILMWSEQPPTVEQLIKRYKSNYMGDIETCKQIYLPICDHMYEHWYLCIVNMMGNEAYLLDSFPLKDDSPRKDTIKKILSVLDEMLHHKAFGIKSTATIPVMKTLEVKSIPVEQQPNGTDCGVHVIQYMRYCPTNLRDVTSNTHGLDARKEIVSWLLLHKQNKKREDNIFGSMNIVRNDPKYAAEQSKAMRDMKAMNKSADAMFRSMGLG